MIAVLALAWRLRKLIAILAVVAAVWGAWHWFNGVLDERQQLRQDVAKSAQELDKAVGVNRANTAAMKELKADMDLERALTAKELNKAEQRRAASEQIIRELKNEPGYNDPAGAVWDAYSRRLRGASANHGH